MRSRRKPQLAASRALLALLVTAALAVPAFAQTLPPGMTMHRQGAGQPDASGWTLAASTAGGFSVRLPVRFNDFTLAESDPASPVLRIHGVGGRSPDDIKLTATRVVYRDGAASARLSFSRFQNGQDLGAAPERIRTRKLGERLALDLALRNNVAVSYQRVVLLESDLLLMVVESPVARDAAAQKLAATFFDSLSVQAK